MPEITLYGPPQSTYVRTARMVCEEKGASYELEPVEFGSPEHLALHPFARVPVLRFDDALIYETAAIGLYLDDALDGIRLVPQDIAARVDMVRWISAVNDYCYQTMIREIVLPRVGVAEVDESVTRDAIVETSRQLGIADQALAGQSWLAGDAISLADLLLAPIVYYLMAFPDLREMVEGQRNVQRWYGEVSARPAFKKTEPPRPQ